MAQETSETTAAARPSAGGLAHATTPSRDRKGHFVPRAARVEPPEDRELEDDADSDDEATEEQQPPDHTESEYPALPESVETGAARLAGQARVQALLTEALRLGEQYGLLTRHPDGTLLLPGQTKQRTRENSDCTCAACAPHHQRHWWCVVCSSGPHDWLLVKPQYERQTLRAGGIEGQRQAACSAQCARDYLASLGRQPAGLVPDRTIDPTLALPG